MDIVIIGKSKSIITAICELLKDEGDIKTHTLSSSKVFDDADYDKMCQASIIIIDLNSIDTNSRLLITEVHELFPKAGIIALHIYSSRVLIRPIINAGAAAYLLVNTSKQELLETVRKVHGGDDYISCEIT